MKIVLPKTSLNPEHTVNAKSPVAESWNHIQDIAHKGFKKFCKIVKTQHFSTLRRENCSINAFGPEEHKKISFKNFPFFFRRKFFQSVILLVLWTLPIVFLVNV